MIDAEHFVQQWLADNARGMRIEGFGVSDPPPPVERGFVAPQLAPDGFPLLDEGEPEIVQQAMAAFAQPVQPPPPVQRPAGPPSPLVAIAQPAPAPPVLTGHEVMVLGSAASFQGHPVVLSTKQVNQIAATIMKAIHDDVKAKYRAMLQSIPKRGYAKKAKADAAEPPKKRTRSRKNAAAGA